MISIDKNPGSEPEQQYVFEPEADISAYELAQLLPFLIVVWRKTDVYATMNNSLLPSGMKQKINDLPEGERLCRHFRKL